MRRARSRLMESGRTSRSSHRPSVSAERPSATSAGVDVAGTRPARRASRTERAHHVVVGLVALGADAPVGRPESALAPEREPDRELVALADAAPEVEIDHRRQAGGRRAVGPRRGLAAGVAVFVGEVAQGLGEQALLALEMQVDDSLAQARLAGDGRDGGVRQPPIGDAADRRLDQLLAPFLGRRSAPARAAARGGRLGTRLSTLLKSNTYVQPRPPVRPMVPIPCRNAMNECLFSRHGRRGPVLWESVPPPQGQEPVRRPLPCHAAS